jgi:dienelactone hydrolase
MSTANMRTRFVLVAGVTVSLLGCSGTDGSTTSASSGDTSVGGAAVGGSTSAGGTSSVGGVPTGGTLGIGGVGTGGIAATGGALATGGMAATGGSKAVTGGASATGGTVATGGANATGGTKATATGGTKAGTGGVATGGVATGGATSSSSGQGGAIADAGTACTIGTWPAADPSKTGPFATVTEQNVGPQAGVGVDGGTPPQFTLFRPSDMVQGGLCHPVITWGNGTGSTPNLYGVFLRHLASHGFVVIASNSTNVAQGTPAPMLAGVTWVLQQNADPTSVMYQRIDATHIGATGHSQGGFATTTAGADSRITTIAPFNGASTQRNLHGPAFLFCGGADTTVPCSTIQTAFNAITNQPAMLADYLTADHANWITFRTGAAVSVVEATVAAWMRLQLMGDTALRPRFYGPSCTLCQDSAWQITQNSLMAQ